jgi:phytoene dehydrogenase-like protein
MFDARNAIQPSLLRVLVDLRPGQSVKSTVRSLVPDARVAQMLDHFTQYVGSAPDQSPAVLCGIAHIQTNEGVWYPRGGIGAVPRTLEALTRDLGVEFRCDVGVRRILQHADGRVRGLVADDEEEVPVAAAVVNADTVRAHRELIGCGPRRRFERRRSYEPACSVVLYLGLDCGYEHLAHHNFVFSHDPDEEFDAIYRRGEPAPDPTCYVASPARTEPGLPLPMARPSTCSSTRPTCGRTMTGTSSSPLTAEPFSTNWRRRVDSMTWNGASGSSDG